MTKRENDMSELSPEPEQPRTCGGCARWEPDAEFGPDCGDCYANLPVSVVLIKGPLMVAPDTDATDCPCYVAKTGATRGPVMGNKSNDAEKYLELLYQVDTKIPGESRHETAKRWLRERREQDCNNGAEGERR